MQTQAQEQWQVIPAAAYGELYAEATAQFAAWHGDILALQDEIMRLYGDCIERAKQAFETNDPASNIFDVLAIQQRWFREVTRDGFAAGAKIREALDKLGQDSLAFFPLARASNQNVNDSPLAKAAE